MRDELEICGECRNSFSEPPAYNTWDCEYALEPEWDEENECWNCLKFKRQEWNEE